MSLKDHINIKYAIGIEVEIKGADSFSFRLVALKKQGNKLTTEKSFEALKSFEELKPLINKRHPIVLTITGKGIINKIVDTKNNQDHSSLLTQALPGANTKDFSIQVSKINDEFNYISLLRINILDSILNGFNANGIINISNCFLGPFVLNEALESININADVLLGSQKLTIENHVISKIEIASEDISETITIGDEKIPMPLIIAWASAFQGFISSAKGIENSERLIEFKQEFKAKIRFEKTGLISLIIVFVILMINYFTFSSYWEKNQKLTSLYSLNESSVSQHDTLKKEYLLKKQFLEVNGLLENSKTSLYADRLAKDLPNTISWTSLKCNPLKSKKNNEKDIHLFENKTMEIAGKCQESTDLNNWMKQLKAYDWVDQITLLNYTQAKNELGLFLLVLKTK